MAIDVIDSVIGEKEYLGGEITDPYGTLHGCVLFSSVRYLSDQDSGFFGIYKEGKIIWTSDNIIQGVWQITFKTEDINKDGKIDILTTWHTNGDPKIQEMWIFSWDGIGGNIINQIDDNFGESVIQGEGFELVDHDSTGVKDIVATTKSKDDEITVFFRWDGTRYVHDRELKRRFNGFVH